MRIGLELVFTGAGMVEQTEELLKCTAEGVDRRDKFFSSALNHKVLLHPHVTKDGELDRDAYCAICGGVPQRLEENNRLYYMRDFIRNFRPVIKVLKAIFNLSALSIQSEVISPIDGPFSCYSP